MALAGDKSFLMPLWKTKLLKMNQQRLNPRSWEEDEGASYNFPEDLGGSLGSGCLDSRDLGHSPELRLETRSIQYATASCLY